MTDSKTGELNLLCFTSTKSYSLQQNFKNASTYHQSGLLELDGHKYGLKTSSLNKLKPSMLETWKPYPLRIAEDQIKLTQIRKIHKNLLQKILQIW